MAPTFAQPEIDDGKALAIVAYITVIGLIIAALLGKEKRFCMYHVQQSLVLLIACLAAGVLSWIPFLGWILGGVAGLGLFVLWILGVVNAAQGKAEPIPLIGHFGDSFNLVR